MGSVNRGTGSTAAAAAQGRQEGVQVQDMAYSRSGQGEPLVLLHGIGSSREVWDPVGAALAQRFDVTAVDLPGFGASAPLPPGTEPSPGALAAAVAALLAGLGIDRPHLAGNSLGGWVAIELAKIRPVRSVTLLSPAGLWRGDTPRYCMTSLRLSRWLAFHAGPALSRIVATRPGRVLVLGQMLGRPARLPAAQARAMIRALGTCPGFDAALQATARRHISGGQHLTAPVTIAFGSRDIVLLRRQSRHLGELPPGIRTADLPGCGHVPMSDDPDRVTELIINSAARGSAGPSGDAGPRAVPDPQRSR